MTPLRAWVVQAHRIQVRRISAALYRAAAVHLAKLSREIIRVEPDLAALASARNLLIGRGHYRFFARPVRGRRADAPQTPLIVEIDNRVRHLERERDMPPGHNAAAFVNATQGDQKWTV